MRVRHPNTVRDTVDDVDSGVHLGGEVVPVGDDDTLEVSDRQADELARLYDMEVADIRVDEQTDAGTTDGDESDTCEVVKTDGEVCGRDLPCPYHGGGAD
jgi:hypothetical protein